MSTTEDLSALLRREVGLLRARESRRVFDTRVHVGSLAGPRQGLTVLAQDLPVVDRALRTDLVSRLVAEALADDCGLTVWLARAGDTEVSDLDLRWLAAATAACGEHGGTPAGFYVVTRAGWMDPRSGQRRTWKRLRL